MTQTLHKLFGQRNGQVGADATVHRRVARMELSRVRTWIGRAAGTFIRRDPAEEIARIEACSKAVRDASLSLRLGRIEEAETILHSIAGREPRHSACLNLMGVICESRGDWRRARRFYGKAMRADRSFAAAEQNMRRWYELFTFGRTKLPVALGDESDRL